MRILLHSTLDISSCYICYISCQLLVYVVIALIEVMYHHSQQPHDQQNSLGRQQQQQDPSLATLVISNIYRVAKRIHTIGNYFVDPGFDVNGSNVAIGIKWNKCSCEHSVFDSDLIILKEKYLCKLITHTIDQITYKMMKQASVYVIILIVFIKV